MEREIDLKEISDGKLYTANDMVKTGCNDCKGCFACCKGMGNSIILDPYDMYQLMLGTDKNLEQMLEKQLALNVVEGIILPNLKMQPERDACAFLNEEGRCGIHNYRPGFCRMFPLGRFYDAERRSFQYFLQIRECAASNKTKVKLKKWLGIPEIGKYEQYVADWHYFLKMVKSIIENSENGEIIKKVNMLLLGEFYGKPYEKTRDFYQQFYERLEEGETVMAFYK